MAKPTTKYCTACKQAIPFSATKCAYCRTKQPASMTVVLLAGTFVLLLVLGCSGAFDWVFGLVDSASTSTARPRESVRQASTETLRSSALSIAQRYVKERLRAPGSAKWPGMFEGAGHASIMSDGRYYVRSWVDSHNGFGALVRTEYAAFLRYEGDKWTLERLEMDE